METRPLLDYPLLSRCREASTSDEVTLGQITRLLREGDLCDEAVARLRRPDPSHPYGRQVLIESDTLEAMVATWTRGVPCVPHDHGGSVGGVRVLRGAALHRIWKIEDGALVLVREHRAEAGEILACGPDLIHSMGDAGGDEPLMTLHLYTDPIAFMVIYDVDAGKTLMVDGGCGAWVPEDQPELIKRVREGVLSRGEIAA